LNKEILKLAIPNVLSNLSVPMLSAVDTALMGHLSPIYLGAIGLGSMIFNFIYWNFGFLRMGTTGMIAQSYGAEDHDKTIDLLTAALRLSMLISIGLILLSPILFDMMNRLLYVQDIHHSVIASYTRIRIYDAPATIMLYVLTGWFFGRQNALIPLVVTIIINVLNIIISYVLVHCYEMNIAGVAWGTVMSQYIGVIIMMILMIIRSEYSFGELIRSRTSINMGQFISVNRDLFIRTILLTMAFVLLYRYSNQLGPIELAANVIILQILNWISFGIDGFAFAAESIVGKYKGQNKQEMLFHAVKLCIRWGAGLAFVYTLIFLFGSSGIVKLYSQDIAVNAHVETLKPWVLALPFIGFICYIFDGIFIGLLETQFMRNSMIISFGIFVVLVVFLPMSNMVLWTSFCLFLLLRGLAQLCYWYKMIKAALLSA